MPVIFLTSKDDEVDEVLGLRMGADDYIKKPFSQRLLVERIRALLRRGELARGTRARGEPVIQRGELLLDPARHQCTWKGEQCRSHRHRVPHPEVAGAAPGPREKPRPADGWRLWRAHLCR